MVEMSGRISLRMELRTVGFRRSGGLDCPSPYEQK